MDWSLAVSVTSLTSFLVVVLAYFYSWLRGRQPSMALWGLGWVFYSVRFLAMVREAAPMPPSTIWEFVGLAAMGLSGFMLWAGTQAYIGNPLPARAFAWCGLLVAGALVAFIPLSSPYGIFAATPIFAFSALADLTTALALFHHSKAVGEERAGWVVGLVYGAWAGFKISDLILAQSASFMAILLLTHVFALVLAFSLIVLSLVEAERHARRRADRLNALAVLTGATGQPLSPQELLAAVLGEVGRMLGVQQGLGGVLVDGAEGRMRLVTTQVLSPPCPLQEGREAEDCPCRASVAAAQVTWLKKKRRPDACCHATLAIPLVTWDRVVGVICAALPPGRLLSEGERRTLRTLGRQLGTAVENARLGVGMDMELRRLRALADASRHMIADLDTHTAMRGIVAAARQALAVDRAALYLYDAETKRATVGHAEGISQSYLDLVVANFDRLLESISAEGQRGIVYVENVASDDDPSWQAEGQKEGFCSTVVLPLYHRQRVLGVLSFYHDTVRVYSPEDRQFCRALADQAAMVVANALLYQEARRRLEELAALHEVDIQVSSALSLEQVLAAVAEQLRRVLGVMTLYIGLYDAELDELDLQIIVDNGQFRPPLRVRFADAPSLAGWVARTGEPLWVDDFPNEAGRLPSGFMPVGDATRAITVLPLTVKGKVVGVLSVQSYKPYAFDVGNRRLLREIATQAAIAIENARIYQQLEDQSAQLGSALHELQEVERMRSELVQNVSHELRTPLTLIEGYVDLLLSGDLGPIQAAQREALDVIYDRAMALSRLIYNLTALQSIPRDEMLLKELAVVDLIEHVLNGHRRSAERARVHFEPELPDDLPPIEGDWEHLGLAFSHLIDNAIKFSPDGGPVHIRAWQEGQSVKVSIQDQGIGIAPECLDRIFERFYQADGSTTRRFGGMGVGLALVWEIVEAHRGTVIVKSQPGEGSTFIVSLPILVEAG